MVNSSNDYFEFYEMTRSWEESEATFNQADASTAWDVAGAAGSGDHESTVLGAITAPQTGWATAELNSFGLAVIQSWIGNSAANFGLALQDYTNATTDDLDFQSSESGSGPILSVTYSATAESNQVPQVDAGSPQTILMGEVATLAGSVSDDGRPDPPSAPPARGITTESTPSLSTI